MWQIPTAYFCIGGLCLALIANCAFKKKVSSTFVEGMLDPFVIGFAIILWPAFFLNDVFRYIPKQRKERLELLREEKKEAQVRRLNERERFKKL